MNVITLVHGRATQLANLIAGLERSSIPPGALWVVWMNEVPTALHSERFPIHALRVDGENGALPLARARNAIRGRDEVQPWVFLDVDCIPSPTLLEGYRQALAAHPQALLAAGRARATHTFASNRLNLTVRRTASTATDDWLTLLANPALTLGTSTPGCDPSGDYTWQLFDNIERERPGLGQALKQRAKTLVGGRDTLSVPPGEMASAWLIRQGLADLFIGYRHYALVLDGQADLRVVEIPARWNIRCEYQLALLDDAPATERLARFILGREGQTFLRDGGFSAPDVE